MKRRDFITLLGSALAVQAIPANAQEPVRVRTVGVLMGLANDAEAKARVKAFEQGLEREGWSVGQNLRIEYRYAEGDSVRMQAFAKELVELKLVASMARPEGNMTGFMIFPATIAGKYLATLKEMVPQLARAAILYNPDSAPATGTFFLPPFADAAKEFKIQPITAQVRNPAEIESAITKLGREPNSGLIVMPDNFTAVHRKLIISLVAQFRIPAIYPYRYFAEEGGLLSNGVNTSELFRRAAKYVSRILRGAKPADLPVQTPTKFELVINLRTAKALGIAIPKMLLAGADRVIE